MGHVATPRALDTVRVVQQDLTAPSETGYHLWLSYHALRRKGNVGGSAMRVMRAVPVLEGEVCETVR